MSSVLEASVLVIAEDNYCFNLYKKGKTFNFFSSLEDIIRSLGGKTVKFLFSGFEGHDPRHNVARLFGFRIRVLPGIWRTVEAKLIESFNGDFIVFIGTLGHDCDDLVKSALKKALEGGALLVYVTHSELLASEQDEDDSAVTELLKLGSQYAGYIVYIDQLHSFAEQ